MPARIDTATGPYYTTFLPQAKRSKGRSFMSSKDFFSLKSESYSKYRPLYPPGLYRFLASKVREKRRVWDSATGNGQAAVGLAPYFDEVIATDVNESQIAHALKREKIRFLVAPSEKTPIESVSIDLITVASAMHLLD